MWGAGEVARGTLGRWAEARMSGEGRPETDRGTASLQAESVTLLEASWAGGGVLVTWSCPPRQYRITTRRSRGAIAGTEAGEWAPGVELHPAHHLPAVHVRVRARRSGDADPSRALGPPLGEAWPSGAPAVPQAWVPPSPFPSPSFPLELEDPSGFSSPPHPAAPPRSLALQGFLTRRPHYLLQEVKSGPPAPDCLNVPRGRGLQKPAGAHPGQHPGARAGQVLRLRPVLRRDQRHPAARP